MAITVVLASVHAIAQLEKPIQPGDDAPPLAVARWLNSDRVRTQGVGKLQVIEFTATWCGACIKSIPHLNDLAQTYREHVDIISIYTFSNKSEDPNGMKYQQSVQELLAGQRYEIQFTWCVDSVGNMSAKRWGVLGVPRTFVLGAQGKVLWVGHPLMGLDAVLDNIIRGTFDAEVEYKVQIGLQAVLDEIEALPPNEYRVAVDKLDSLRHSYPLQSWLLIRKFRFLAEHDDPDAGRWLQWIFNNAPETMQWSRLATYISYYGSQPDYDSAFRALERAKHESGTPDRIDIHTEWYNIHLRRLLRTRDSAEKGKFAAMTKSHCKEAIRYFGQRGRLEKVLHFQKQLDWLEKEYPGN